VIRVLFVAVREILVGDRKHCICLELDVPHHALPFVAVADPRVIAPGLDARDAQPFVMVDFPVLVV
jgi:hypothetical protein